MREGALRKPPVSETPTSTGARWFFLQFLNSGTVRVGLARPALGPGVSLARSDSTGRAHVHRCQALPRTTFPLPDAY